MTSTPSTSESSADRVAREDLVMFINASFACSGQREFYSDASGQSVSIEFLHHYILGNYRRLYVRTLAAGVNHFNQSQIVFNVLATGADTQPQDRAEENALITAALAKLPPQRVYRLFDSLRARRVNNRRTRAVMRAYIAGRRDIAFDAIKYRQRLRVAASHAHLALPGEIGAFLFRGWRQRTFSTELLETFRQAHFSKAALYRLPYSVAEGFAAKHGVPRGEFLAGIAEQMTSNEKLRMQRASARSGVALDIDLARAPLTRLAIYVAALTASERAERAAELHQALTEAAKRAARKSQRQLGRVVAVLDRSYSSSGTSEKRRRPLAVAIAASYLLRQAATEYRALWTPALDQADDLHATAAGQTDLAGPLIDALKWRPDLIVMVSDGYENSPPGAACQVVRAYQRLIPGAREVSIVHLNPVFDAEHYAPKTLGAEVPTVGLRDAEDVFTMIGFARFADGKLPLSELEGYLEARVGQFLSSARGARS